MNHHTTPAPITSDTVALPRSVLNEAIAALHKANQFGVAGALNDAIIVQQAAPITSGDALKTQVLAVPTAIMELPVDPRQSAEYRRGHRDARHAAADLVLAKADELAALASRATDAPAQGELAAMEARKDAAYLERNQVVAALAKCFPSGVARTAIEGWSEDWHGCVYIDLPTGQASWHFHDSQAYLFDGLPAYAGKWDGHTTDEKYARLAKLAAQGEQMPVAVVDEGEDGMYADILPNVSVKVGQKLYAAPVAASADAVPCESKDVASANAAPAGAVAGWSMFPTADELDKLWEQTGDLPVGDHQRRRAFAVAAILAVKSTAAEVTPAPATAASSVPDDVVRDAKRYRTWRDAMLNESDEEMERIRSLLPEDSNGLRKPTATEWDVVLDTIAQSAEGGREA